MGRRGGNLIDSRHDSRWILTAVLGLLFTGVVAVPLAKASDRKNGAAVAGLPTAISSGPVVATAAFSRDALESRAHPWIQPNMFPAVQHKILEANQVALQKIQELPECAGMFAALGADGSELLRATLYFPIENPVRRRDFCSGFLTYTYVGASASWLCPDFKRLSVERAALVLIHEALHHAGLTEYPVDRNGMTSLEINRMVKEKCGF